MYSPPVHHMKCTSMKQTISSSILFIHDNSHNLVHLNGISRPLNLIKLSVSEN